MDMNCDRCQHSGVCMYEAGSRAFERDIMGKERPAFIDIRVECEKFRFKFKNGTPKAAKTTVKKEVDA